MRGTGAAMELSLVTHMCEREEGGGGGQQHVQGILTPLNAYLFDEVEENENVCATKDSCQHNN